MDIAMIGVGVDTRQIKQGEKALQGLIREGTKTEQVFNRVAASLLAAFSVQKVVQYADAYTSLQNRLKLVTDSQEELAAATDDVFQIAQRSRSALGATGDLYFKIAQNADKLALSTQDVADVTETIAQTLAISGASAQSSEAAILQFSQALASGAIRGDEFNSVAENAPALMDALARSLNVTKGELRTLAAEGRLSSEALIKALQEQSEEIATAYAKTDATVSQAMTGLSNSLTMIIGDFDNATGASTALADSILDLSRWLDEGGFIADAAQWTVTWASALGDVSSGLQELTVDTSELSGMAFKAFVELPSNITAAIKIAAVEVADFMARASEGLIVSKERLRELDEVRRDSIDTILAERDAQLGAGAAAKKAVEDEKKARKELREQRELDATIAGFVKEGKGGKTAAQLLAETSGTKKGKKTKEVLGPTDAEISLMVSMWSDEATRAFESQFSDEAIDAYINTIAEEHQNVLALNEEFRRMDLENEQRYADAKATIASSMMGVASDLANNLIAYAKASGEEQSTLGRTAVAAAKGIQIAMAIINAETAATATLAAYAQLGALGDPTAAARGVIMSNIVRGIGYASAATIAATEVAGARAMGGQVQAGNSYLVGERGPELLTMGANSGNITPNHRMGGEKVTIINQTQGRIDNVQERRMPDGERIMIIQQARDLVVGEMRDPNSKTSRAMAASTNVQRRRA